MTEYCDGVVSGAQSCPTGAAHVGYPTGGALAGVWHDTTDPSVMTSPISWRPRRSRQPTISGTPPRRRTGTPSTSSSPRAVLYPDGFNFNRTPQFCGWHDVSSDPALLGASLPLAVAFTNMPYVPDAGGACGAGFVNGGSAGALDGVTIVAGDEYAGTITDQFPSGGWRDGAGNENGDKCAWIPAGSGQGAAQNIILATGSFAVQSTWANDFNAGRGGCEVSHSIVLDNATTSAPAITSTHDVSSVTGNPLRFTVTTTGLPTPAVGYSGSLPPGVTFTDTHDGSATLAGRPAAGTAGPYPLIVTAANGIGSSATQSLTLTVNENGTIVNFAGDPAGTSGSSGDGGAANAAHLDYPQGVAVDAAGDVYIADYYNFSVRKVDRSGTITNFAGVPHPLCCPKPSGDGGPGDSRHPGPPLRVGGGLSRQRIHRRRCERSSAKGRHQRHHHQLCRQPNRELR